MSAGLFFIGCLAFFGIPALCVIAYANAEQKEKSTKIKREFLAQYQ